MPRRRFHRGLFDPGVESVQIPFPAPPGDVGPAFLPAIAAGKNACPTAPAAPVPDRQRPVPGRKVYTVGELTALVKGTLERAFAAPLWVEGEVSNLSRPSSGHSYFTLKDGAAQLAVVLFRDAARRALAFALNDGQQVLVRGRLGVYAARGQYQLVADRIEPSGAGALALAFEALKRKLAAEGLFDPARKRPLPPFPRAVGVVTSPSGAALRDILKVLRRRWPRLGVVIVPVRVQGEGAAEEIADGIKLLNEAAATGAPGLGPIDVLIVGRGGGSVEDLQAFNEEIVARAIAASAIPVVSAVGHEVDFTIADFVADVRAATPSQAAELVVPVLAEVELDLAETAAALRRGLLGRLELARARVGALAARSPFRAPLALLEPGRQRADELAARLTAGGAGLLGRSREGLAGLVGKLESLSPLKVLGRGYSLTTRLGALRPLADAAALAPGERIETRLARGRVTSVVEERAPEAGRP